MSSTVRGVSSRCLVLSGRSACWKLLSLVLAAVACDARPCLAAEPYRLFLRGLWARGYGDAAVDYVDSQRRRSDLPNDIRTTIELDLARSLRIAADEATSSEAAARRLASARTHLDHFLQEHADHPEVAGAYALLGELTLGRGQELLRSAQLAEPGDARAALMRQAREEFEAARPHFAKAAQQFADRLAKMPAPPRVEAYEPPPAANLNPAHKPPAKSHAKVTAKVPSHSTAKAPPAAVPKPSLPTERMLVEEQWLDAKFKVVVIDFDIAQTFGEADEFSKQASLKAAAEGFDALYQRHRLDRLGLVAHLWYGRVEEQLGESETALDVYDEVLGIVPESADQRVAADVMEVLCEAEGRRLQLLNKLGQRDAAIAEAEQWLEQFSADRRSPQNLEIALELCKFEFAKADTLSGDERAELMRSTLAALTEIAKVPGSHQREAAVLWRKHLGNAEKGEGATLTEALAVAAAAARNRLWDEAIEGYGRAIRMGREPADSKQLMAARLELARVQFFAGKLEDAIRTADALANDPRAGAVAPGAALLGVSAAWNRLVSAQAAEKSAAEVHVESLARLVIQRWPSSPEADEAHLTLAKLKLMHDDQASALPLLKAVSPTSDRYRAALYLMAQAYWRLHLEQLKKPLDGAPRASSASLEQQAVAALETLIKLDGKTPADGAAPPDELRDALLLLAEIHLSMKQPAQAAPLVARLVASVKLDRGQPLDATAMHTMALAMKVYIADHQLTKAHEAASLLLEIGPDERQVNAALVDYIRLVRSLPESKQPAVADPTAAQPTASLQLVGLLDKMEGRKQFSVSDRVFLGTVCRELSRRAQAVDLLQGALRQAQQDLTRPTPQMTRALTQLRLLVVDLLREERRYAEAATEADRLVADNPRVLEPMIHRAQVLQDWSKLTPEKLAAAVAAWMRVREALQGVQPKPVEYYEAVYNTAECLFRQGRETGDDARLLQAEQMLKSTTVLYPKLHGPESVEKFQALLARIVAARPSIVPVPAR